MRIHAMLAMVAKDQEEQIRMALDAKFFLIKIFDISFNTLNQMEENAAKYASILDDCANNKDLIGAQTTRHALPVGGQAGKTVASPKNEAFAPLYALPSNIKEWI